MTDAPSLQKGHTFSPAGPHLLILPKQFHLLETKHSNIGAHGRHSHSDYHVIICFLNPRETFLYPAWFSILSTDKGVLAKLEQTLKKIDEECRMEESRRVDLELSIMEVKDNLKKAEAGPVTLGTTVDTTHLDNMSPRVSAGLWRACELYTGPPGTGW
jgi:hypothetical protein